MKMKFLFSLSLITALFFSSCSDDDENVDTVAPTVKNVTLNGMSENIAIIAGTEVEFEAEFEDNVQLGQYRFDIHNNFNGHSHGRVAETDTFGIALTFELTGKTETVHEHIDIPSNATPGEYHFTLQFFDAAGNEGEVAVLAFEIIDPANQPVIKIESHDILSEIEVAPGGSITLEGEITDPDGLEEVHVLLASEDEDHAHGRNNEGEIFEKEFLLDGALSWNFSSLGEISIPEDTAPGHYELTIRAEDIKGFVKSVSIEVHVE